jgi:hypothetical protein
MKTDKVVLSTALVIGEGVFTVENISLEEAQLWVLTENPWNFCGHITVKLVGMEPATHREQCEEYEEALVLKPLGRLEFGREYSVEELLKVGVQPMMITKVK